MLAQPFRYFGRHQALARVDHANGPHDFGVNRLFQDVAPDTGLERPVDLLSPS